MSTSLYSMWNDDWSWWYGWINEKTEIRKISWPGLLKENILLTYWKRVGRGAGQPLPVVELLHEDREDDQGNHHHQHPPQPPNQPPLLHPSSGGILRRSRGCHFSFYRVTYITPHGLKNSSVFFITVPNVFEYLLAQFCKKNSEIQRFIAFWQLFAANDWHERL